MKRFDMLRAPIEGTSLEAFSVHDTLGWYLFRWMSEEDMVQTHAWMNEAHEAGRLVIPRYEQDTSWA